MGPGHSEDIMANLYGFSCGECYHVYEARLWEPQCPRCKSADTMQISDASDPAPAPGAPLAVPTVTAYCVRCKRTWQRSTTAHTDYCVPCRDVLVANTRHANAYQAQRGGYGPF
jgi:hypothetical protein